MTLDELEAQDKEFLSIPDVAEYLGKQQQNVRESLRLGVPWGYVMGNADFRIPRRAFVNYHRLGSPTVNKNQVHSAS